jgi:thiol:disulfide interchange protein DsbD
VYFTEVVVSVPFQRSDYGAHPAEIRLTYQGCAKAGLCYPPISKVLYPDPGPTVQTEAAASPHLASMGRRGYASWQAIAIGGGLAAFVLAGLLLRKNRGLQMPSP